MSALGGPRKRRTPEEAVAAFRRLVLFGSLPGVVVIVALWTLRSGVLWGPYHLVVSVAVIATAAGLLAFSYFVVAPMIGRAQADTDANERG